MSALARLQRVLQRRVLRRQARVEREFVGTPALAARERLEIYSCAYRARLVGALAKDYPGLKALLGDRGFERLARAYVEVHPSRYANLRWYGGGLAAFLRKSGPRRRRALAEMAAFEWALGLAFDAADAPVLEVSAIASQAPADWPGLRFSPHPSLRRLDLHFNVPALRAAADAGKPLPPLRHRRRPVSWLIWRKELGAQYRSLEHDETQALDLLLRGETFDKACERLARIRGSEAALRAASLLKVWFGEGLFVAAA